MAHLDRRETLRLLMLQIGAALLGGSAERSFGQVALCTPQILQDDSFNDFIKNIYPKAEQSAKDLRQAYDLCARTILKEYNLSSAEIEDIVLFQSVNQIRNHIDQSTASGKDLFNKTQNWGTFLRTEFTTATLGRQLKKTEWGKVCEEHFNEPAPQYPMPKGRIFVIRDEDGSNDKLEGKSEETVKLTIFGQGFVADKNDIKIEFLEYPGPGATFLATVKDISGTYRCGCIEIEAKLPKVDAGKKKKFVLNVEQKVASKTNSAMVNLEYAQQKFTVNGP